MAFIQGEGRSQGTLFPVTLDELIPEDHVCRVIDAFVGRLDVAGLGFERAEAAETGRPCYDPRDLLKLYLYGYLQQFWLLQGCRLECCPPPYPRTAVSASDETVNCRMAWDDESVAATLTASERGSVRVRRSRFRQGTASVLGSHEATSLAR